MEIGFNSSEHTSSCELTVTATSSTGLNDNTNISTKHKQDENELHTTNTVKNFLYESGSQAELYLILILHIQLPFHS